jgi:hypothetical protein
MFLSLEVSFSEKNFSTWVEKIPYCVVASKSAKKSNHSCMELFKKKLSENGTDDKDDGK